MSRKSLEVEGSLREREVRERERENENVNDLLELFDSESEKKS